MRTKIHLVAAMLTGLAVGGAVHAQGAAGFTLKSPAFEQGRSIPSKYTCDGADISVPLSWTDPPAGTRSFVLIAQDPDAPGGTWTHWVLYDVPAQTHQLPENLPHQARLPNGMEQGVNDFQRTGYGGPCPPPGPAHHYVFTLYALSQKLTLPPGATKHQVESALKPYVLGKTTLIGRYGR